MLRASVVAFAAAADHHHRHQRRTIYLINWNSFLCLSVCLSLFIICSLDSLSGSNFEITEFNQGDRLVSYLSSKAIQLNDSGLYECLVSSNGANTELMMQSADSMTARMGEQQQTIGSSELRRPFKIKVNGKSVSCCHCMLYNNNNNNSGSLPSHPILSHPLSIHSFHSLALVSVCVCGSHQATSAPIYTPSPSSLVCLCLCFEEDHCNHDCHRHCQPKRS